MRLVRNTLVAIVLTLSSYAANAMELDYGMSVLEPPSRFMPGRYYFKKAQFYMKNKQMTAALEMLERAAGWGNKYAQYDLGVIYFNGLNGVAADRPRGMAWFGVAAQNHGALADEALIEAWKQLSPEERTKASEIADALMVRYNDTHTHALAKARFVRSKREITGSHLGFVGTIAVINLAEGVDQDGSTFMAEQSREFDDMIRGFSGKVEVGQVQAIGLDGQPLPNKTLGASAADKAEASH